MADEHAAKPAGQGADVTIPTIKSAESSTLSARESEPVPLEDRQLPHGETLVGWLGRRYSIALDDAGLDPQVLPIPVIQDLATLPVDDERLAHLLTLMAPMQRDLARRLADANAPTLPEEDASLGLG